MSVVCTLLLAQLSPRGAEEPLSVPLRSSSLAHIFGNFCPKRTASISFWGFSSTGSSNLGLFFRLEQNFWWPTHLDVLALRINIEELDELHFFSCQRDSFARLYISR